MLPAEVVSAPSLNAFKTDWIVVVVRGVSGIVIGGSINIANMHSVHDAHNLNK